MDVKKKGEIPENTELDIDALEKVTGGAEDPVTTPTDPIDPDIQERS